MTSKLEKLTAEVAAAAAAGNAPPNSIDLSNSGLDELPLFLESLAENIQLLNLGGNAMSQLPSWFSKFRSLKILFFANNKFESIPEILSTLPSLYMLSFKSNRIIDVSETCLPSSIGWLILTDNQISRLPCSIGSLTSLKKVMLTGNRLSSLPDEMSKCREIELLRLSANNFVQFPSWLFLLPKLTWLALSGNPRDSEDYMVDGSGGKTISGNGGSSGSSSCCSSSDSSRSDAVSGSLHNLLSPLPQTSAAYCGGDQMPDIDWADIRLGSKLGEGASGYVYEASLCQRYAIVTTASSSVSSSLGISADGVRKVAIKIFKGDMTSDGTPKDELNILKIIGRHKSMISVEGNLINCSDNRLGVVLSLVSPEYSTLARPPSFESVTRDVYFEGETFEFKNILELVLEVASVFAHLHGLMISHGDLYGHNILYNRHTGSCLITDFGAATSYRYISLLDSNSRDGFNVTDEFEKIEVRAFGILCEELILRINLGVNAPVPYTEIIEHFKAFNGLMLVDDGRGRPSFRRIVQTLQAVKQSFFSVTI